MTKAVLRVTDYIFAPTKASYIDMNGIRDLIQITEIYKQENPKLQIKKIFLVQAKENTKVFKKAKEELGWEATKTLEDMCKDSWRYIEKNS